MIRTRLAVVLAVATLSAGCGGAGLGGSASGSASASASVSASAEIDLPLAKMPAKYASWVVEAEGYLFAVNEAYAMHTKAMAELAAALGVEANAEAIANFIRSSIQVKAKMVCQPPSLNASLAADCRAQATARAGGSAGGGGASGDAAAGIQSNCEAKASLSLSPGSCKLETTVTQHPILSDPARWAKVEANMKIVLQLSAANAHLDGRGAGINSRGMRLYADSVTDLAKDPTLALQLNKIQGELKKGSDAAGAANDKQGKMNSELGTMTDAIDAQFPDLRASIKAG